MLILHTCCMLQAKKTPKRQFGKHPLHNMQSTTRSGAGLLAACNTLYCRLSEEIRRITATICPCIIITHLVAELPFSDITYMIILRYHEVAARLLKGSKYHEQTHGWGVHCSWLQTMHGRMTAVCTNAPMMIWDSPSVPFWDE